MCFLGIALFAAVAIAILARDDMRTGMTAAVVGFFFMGFAPAFVVYDTLMKDVRTAERLIRVGQAYSGTITKHQRLPYGGLHLIDVRWQEASGTQTARFDIPAIELTGTEEVVVLADAGWRYAAAAFGSHGAFIGRRAWK